MGHEGFYKFLLAAMGNVVSALLMYALQAAWLCQRLIDQDYRQNHGSRLTPIADNKDISKPIEIMSTPSEMVLSKNLHSRMRHSRQGSKTKKQIEAIKTESSRSYRSSGDNRRQKYGHRSRNEEETASMQKLYLSHPYLEKMTNALTMEYMNGLGKAVGLRRAFSDINLSSSTSEFMGGFCQKSFSCLTNETTSLSISDKDFINLIFRKGYVT